jgi:hypothetical protein
MLRVASRVTTGTVGVLMGPLKTSSTSTSCANSLVPGPLLRVRDATVPVNTTSADSVASAWVTPGQASGPAGAAPAGPPSNANEPAAREAASRRRTADFTGP